MTLTEVNTPAFRTNVVLCNRLRIKITATSRETEGLSITFSVSLRKIVNQIFHQMLIPVCTLSVSYVFLVCAIRYMTSKRDSSPW